MVALGLKKKVIKLSLQLISTLLIKSNHSETGSHVSVSKQSSKIEMKKYLVLYFLWIVNEIGRN